MTTRTEQTAAGRKRKVYRRRAKRARREVENQQYADMLQRLLRAFVRRVAAGDPEDVALLARFVREADAALHEAVAQQRQRGDLSWRRLARELGVSGPAAHKRFSRAAR